MDSPSTSTSAEQDSKAGRITVIGVVGDAMHNLDEEARSSLVTSDLVSGGTRHLHGFATWWNTTSPNAPAPPTLLIAGDADGVSRQIAAASGAGQSVCVLASGDPGFFGIVRALLRVTDRTNLRIIPAPSSVSVAFARLGLPWDDATVVSAHGRSLDDAIRVIRLARKVAVLTSPESTPEAVGKALLAAQSRVDLAAVCSRLGHSDESITVVDLKQLASGSWDPVSVVVLMGPAGRPIAGWGGPGPEGKPLAWGFSDQTYAHRDGMVTKSEVRAIALGKLALTTHGVLWDIGAGSGSVGIEAASLCPGLTVFAIEKHQDDIERITENANRAGVCIHVVHGEVPAACAGLPDPDRVFVGGGGMDALDEAVRRLRPLGRIVATFAALDRAATAADRLGNLTQVATSRGKTLPDGSWRLAAENPVFIAWGPEREEERVPEA